MGCIQSKDPLTTESGTESEYKSTFEEQKKLGEGEFGEVKLITKKSDGQSYAVKVLHKGFVFKDNTLYTPMPADTLKMELDILKVLNGEKNNLALDSIYESSSKVYVVTEICSG
jgi:serine/threonine protein kinase